jgi:ATPase complex subunit ATP10
MSNKHIGYLYLIDHKMRIRWAACGFAEPEELHGLLDCASVLLTRLKTGGKD